MSVDVLAIHAEKRQGWQPASNVALRWARSSLNEFAVCCRNMPIVKRLRQYKFGQLILTANPMYTGVFCAELVSTMPLLMLF